MSEGVWIVGAPRCIQNFDANNSTFIVVVDNDAVCDFGAVFDRPVGQIKINRIGGVIELLDAYDPSIVIAGHSRSKNGVASLAYVPAISLMQAPRSTIGMRGSSPRMTTGHSQHRRQHAVGRAVAVHEGLDVDDDLLAHVDAAFDGGRTEMRQQHDLAGFGKLD